MTLHGRHFIGGTLSAEGNATFRASNPQTGMSLEPAFHEAVEAEIDQALRAAAEAGRVLCKTEPQRIASFLEEIATQIEELGQTLIDRASQETGLPEQRLKGERGRTVGQLRLFAGLVREGSWVDARIDTALPDRVPVPRPDVRRMLVPLGPVVVFGASNFPLAFSVAGGDTASAFASGCPVVAKAHPAHPGTCELVAEAVSEAVRIAELPPSVFSMVHGAGHDVGMALVRHPATQAVGFTGSFAGGKALFDAAARRDVPIPVYAEMGSINPLFLLPEALDARAEQIAQGYVESVSLGVGQFCTNPGLVVALEGEGLHRFMEAAGEAAEQIAPRSMLHRQICVAFSDGVGRLAALPGVRKVGASSASPDLSRCEAATTLFATDAKTFSAIPVLSEEVFGPASLVVICSDRSEMEQVAGGLAGHLTASLHATEPDLAANETLVRLLEQRVGRLIVNGFPTGVEVSPAMHHGGPYPATTDPHFTSVGTAAILRWVRPLCYQDFPGEALPPALRDENPLRLWRMVDGFLTRDPVGE